MNTLKSLNIEDDVVFSQLFELLFLKIFYSSLKGYLRNDYVEWAGYLAFGRHCLF